jgi:NADH-quinone oxidoreductase subunit A
MISLGIFGINNAVVAIVALLTGVALVAAAMWIAGLLSPRSFNPQKGEAYECGIPTRGETMTRFKVGYYLFAILFLMFDVETVFLFPWAVCFKSLVASFGVASISAVGVFFVILVLGLVYAWRKGALEWK